MGQNYSTGSMNVNNQITLTGGAGCVGPITGQVLKQYNTTTAGISADATLYTVTAGKTFYLMGWSVCEAALSNYTLTDNGTSKVIMPGKAANNNNSGGSPIASFTTNVSIAKKGGDSFGTLIMSFWGYEQ